MGRQLTEKEIKRFGRVMAGHQEDKDRERWKRKVKGQAKPAERPRKAKPGAVADDEDPLDELAASDEESR